MCSDITPSASALDNGNRDHLLQKFPFMFSGGSFSLASLVVEMMVGQPVISESTNSIGSADISKGPR